MKKGNLPIPKIETQYNLLVQVDYLVGLSTAYMLGAEKWSMFFLLLGLSLGLGWLTVRAWAKTIKGMVNH